MKFSIHEEILAAYPSAGATVFFPWLDYSVPIPIHGGGNSGKLRTGVLVGVVGELPADYGSMPIVFVCLQSFPLGHRGCRLRALWSSRFAELDP